MRLCAILFALLVAICGGPSAYSQSPTFEQKFASLINAARSEGELTWYHGALEAPGREFAAHFQQRFGIKVNHSFVVGAPNLERFRAESRAGRHIADVFNSNDGSLMKSALNEGLIANYRTASIDEFRKDWLQQAGGIAYPTSRVQLVIGYNTTAVKPDEAALLKTWDGLTNSVFGNGRSSLGDASRLGSIYPAYLYFLRIKPTQYGQPFLEKMAALKPAIYNSMTDQVARITAGEVDLGLTAEISMISQYNKGAPVAFTYPSPTPIAIQFTGVSSNAPHPNAARLFLEYITSSGGMEAWGRYYGGATGRPDVDAKIGYKFTKEPWYVAPTEFFAPDDPAISELAAKEYKGVVEDWTKAFRK